MQKQSLIPVSSSIIRHPLDLVRIATVSNRKVFDHKHIKILTPKQMLQILAIALVQVKAGNTSENLLNETR